MKFLKDIHRLASKNLKRALKSKDPDVLQRALGNLHLLRRELNRVEKKLVKTSAVKRRKIENEVGMIKPLKAKAVAIYKDIVTTIRNLKKKFRG